MDDKWVTVVVESPYAGNILKNTNYARFAYKDCLVNRHEAPFASHLNYTQDGVLNDDVEEERWAGIKAGLAVGARLELSAFYVDLGFSKGMRYGLEAAIEVGRRIVFRTFAPSWSASTDVAVTEVADEFGFFDLIPAICIVNGEPPPPYLSPGCP